MNILSTYIRAMAVIGGIAAFFAAGALCYTALAYHQAGFENISSTLIILGGLSLLVGTACVALLKRKRAMDDKDGPAPYCHVGPPH